MTTLKDEKDVPPLVEVDSKDSGSRSRVPEGGSTYPRTMLDRENLFVEGYWKEKEGDGYPWPIPTSTPVDTTFLERLTRLTELNYAGRLKNGRHTGFFGVSMCRLCGQPNGSTEYCLWKGKVVYRYPGGLIHYYRAPHNVQPSREFRDFILSFEEKLRPEQPEPKTERERQAQAMQENIDLTFAFRALEMAQTRSMARVTGATNVVDAPSDSEMQAIEQYLKDRSMARFGTPDPDEPPYDVFEMGLSREKSSM